MNPNASRQAQFKARKRAAGYSQITAWVHAKDRAKVLAYIAGLEKCTKS